MQDAHRGTWYTLADHGSCHATSRGSRPGSPLADLAFNTVMLSVLRDVQTFVDHHPTLQEAAARAGASIPLVAWADDLAVPVLSVLASALDDTVVDVVDFLRLTVESYGMRLNFAAGKTETVLSYRGTGAVQCREHRFLQCGGTLAVPGGFNLRAVDHYKHLGVRFGTVGCLETDIHSRLGRAGATFRQLARPLFHSRRLRVTTRLALLESLVLSQVFHGAGAWPLLTASLFQRLQAAITSWQRQIVCIGFWSTTRLSDQEFRALHNLPSLSVRLAKHRIAFAMQLFSYAPVAVLDAVRLNPVDRDGSWLAAVAHSLSWLQTMSPPDAPLAVLNLEELSFSELQTWCSDSGFTVPLLKRTVLRYLKQEQLVTDVILASRRLTRWLDSRGYSVQFDHTPVPTLQLDFQCPQCLEAFSSPQGLQAHFWTKHQVYSVERRLCFGSVCLCCHTCFWTTQRLQQHLRQSRLRGSGCFFEIASRFAPDPCPVHCDLPEHLKGIERVPAQVVHSPVVPLPAQRFFPPAMHHPSWAAAWNQLGAPDALLYSTYDGVVEVLQPVLQVWCQQNLQSLSDCLLDLFDSPGLRSRFSEVDIVWSFAIWVRRFIFGSWPCILSDPDILLLRGAVADLWTSLPLCQLLDASDHLAGCLPDLAPGQFASATTDSRGRRAKEPFEFNFYTQTPTIGACLPLPPATPVCVEAVPVVVDSSDRKWLYVLHLFSGRRRGNDLHDWLVKLGPSYFQDLGIVVVSVDTAIHPKLGDLLAKPAGPALDELTSKPFFAAAFSGPPCETWSAARHNSLEGISGRRGPRPLRATPDSWGIKFLNMRELSQLGVASRLMLKSLEWEFCIGMQGGSDMMEHPERPDDPAKASIWASAFHRCFMGSWLQAEERSIEQWEFGAVATKPTRLRCANIPGAAEGLRVYRQHGASRPQSTLIGIDTRTGQFRTAAAKEYPNGLCQAMARTALDGLAARIRRSDPSLFQLSELSAQTREWLDCVCKEAMQCTRTTFLPDYQH
eukprot:Skav204987  [mRNA]  locus=scaffold1180:653267:656293:- [translate_table: standard]